MKERALLPIFRIWAIALYEMKALMRSVLYKVFLVSLLLSVYPVILSYWAYTDELFCRLCIVFLKTYAPFLAIFTLYMAVESLIRERHADIYGMVHSRSQSNPEYLLGKALGVFLAVFSGIGTFLVLLAILAGIFLHATFSLPGFLFTFPLITIPMLTVVIGMSFLFAVLVRNKAFTVTFLSAGFLWITLSAESAWYGLSDYAAREAPVLYSDLVGFGNTGLILEQRGFWFLGGVSLIFLASIFHWRTPNSGRDRMIAFFAALICLGSAGVFGYAYTSDIRAGGKERISMNALSREAANRPTVTVTDCRIDLHHRGKAIEAAVNLRVENRTGSPMGRYTFTLNPGLDTFEISRANTPLRFSRNLHILTVESPSPLAPGAADSLTIRYRGGIDQEACWADLPEREWGKTRHYCTGAFSSFGFITPRYILLTPECLWYPTAGAPYGSVFPQTISRDFARFSLRVETAPRLTAISQGMVGKPKPGVWTFAPETALPQISLIIGKYEKKALVVDGVEYALYVKRGHEYYSRYFTLIREKFPKIIREYRGRYETYLGYSYPFPRFSLVETPAHFYSFRRFWSMNMETQQPEMILLPEKGRYVWGANFASNLRWVLMSSNKRTPMEIQERIFHHFSRSLLCTSGNEAFYLRYQRMVKKGHIWPSTVHPQNWTVFPNFYRFTNAVVSDSLPLIDSMIEMYLLSKTPSFNYIVDDFKIASYMLSGRCPGAVLADPEFRDCGPEILKCTSNVLFNRLETEYSRTRMEAFFYDFFKCTRGRNIPADSLFAAFRSSFGRDLEADAENLLNGKSIPACIATDVQYYQISGPKGTLYQMRFTAYNPEPVEGTFAFFIRPKSLPTKSKTMDQREDFTIYRYFTLPGGAAKEIGFTMDEEPNEYFGIETFLSKNRPNHLSVHLVESAPQRGATIFEGERVLDHPPALIAPDEIIVDNIDPGFQTLPGPEPNLLRRLLHRPDSRDWELMDEAWWVRPPDRWSLVVNTLFYGLAQKTARIIKAGEGENRVKWTADIPESGEYQLFYYTPDMKSFFFPDSRVFAKDFHFRVITANGAEELNVDLQDASDGWTPLGSFSLPKGKAVVELSDETKGAEIYADAVKWVRKSNIAQASEK